MVCEHLLYKIYYRQKKKEDDKQRWRIVPNNYYCIKCKKIVTVK